jgi:hypothetical protein
LRRRYSDPAGKLARCVIGGFVDSVQIDPRQLERAPGGLDQREVKVVFTNVYPGDDPAGGEASAVDFLPP